jgi:hypothetical protein
MQTWLYNCAHGAHEAWLSDRVVLLVWLCVSLCWAGVGKGEDDAIYLAPEPLIDETRKTRE